MPLIDYSKVTTQFNSPAGVSPKLIRAHISRVCRQLDNLLTNNTAIHASLSMPSMGQQRLVLNKLRSALMTANSELYYFDTAIRAAFEVKEYEAELARAMVNCDEMAAEDSPQSQEEIGMALDKILTSHAPQFYGSIKRFLRLPVREIPSLSESFLVIHSEVKGKHYSQQVSQQLEQVSQLISQIDANIRMVAECRNQLACVVNHYSSGIESLCARYSEISDWHALALSCVLKLIESPPPVSAETILSCPVLAKPKPQRLIIVNQLECIALEQAPTYR